MFWANTYITTSNSQFQSNTAYYGGSMYVNEENHYQVIKDCSFQNDISFENGASVFFHKENEHGSLEGCNVSAATSVKGAVVIYQDNYYFTIKGNV